MIAGWHRVRIDHVLSGKALQPTAIQVLRSLRATDAAFAVIDNSSSPESVRKGALDVLKSIHDPKVTDGLIQRLRDMGTTLIVAEQNMHFCLDIASHVAVIDKGHIVFRGSIDELRANDEVKKRYLAV